MTVLLLLLVFIALSVGLAWYLIAHDRGPKEPVAALWIAVGFGFVGALAAGWLNSRFIPSFEVLSMESYSHILAAALGVGLIEETCKFLPLALWIYRKPYFNEHTDGVIYFALAGLGFGLPENLLYTMQYGSETGLGRLFMTPFFHAAITGLVGYCLIRIKLAGKPAVWGVLPLAGAILLHALYDFGLVTGSSVYAGLSVLLTLVLSAGLFPLFLRATQRDQLLGLSAVGRNEFCRSCGYPNPNHNLYCTHCGKNA
jgi:RsiW-degrading membrane proteinase PrsW (M82 family)